MTNIAKQPSNVSSQVEDDLNNMLDEHEADTDDQLIEPFEAPVADAPRPGEHPFTEAELYLRERITYDAARKPMPTAKITATLDKKVDFRGTPEVKGTSYNISRIMQNDARTCGAISMDLFSDTIMLNRTVRLATTGVTNIFCKSGGRPLSDGDIATLDTWLGAPKAEGGWTIQPTKANLENGVRNTALLNAHHPIYDVFNSVKWDGVPRMETFFSRYLKLDPKNDVYNRAVSRIFLLAMVTRTFEPGHKFDSMPVLQETKGGAGKSEFVETLAMGRVGILSEPSHILDGKVLQEQTRGSLLVELPELSAFAGANVNTIKAKITLKSDKARAAYAKFIEDLERGWVFIATANEAQNLWDPNRRFLPLAIGCSEQDMIDLDGVRAELPQLFAEVLQEYRRMRMEQPVGNLPLYLTGEAREIAHTLQKKATIETAKDSMEGWLTGWLCTPYTGKFGKIDIDGITYRDRFCLKEAFNAYHNPNGEIRREYKDADAKAWGDVCDAVAMVSKGGKSRFAEGNLTAYMVDRDLLAKELGLVSDEHSEAVAFHDARDASERASRASSKPMTGSAFEDVQAAPVKSVSNVVPLSKTREDIIREDCTW